MVHGTLQETEGEPSSPHSNASLHLFLDVQFKSLHQSASSSSQSTASSASTPAESDHNVDPAHIPHDLRKCLRSFHPSAKLKTPFSGSSKSATVNDAMEVIEGTNKKMHMLPPSGTHRSSRVNK